MWGQPPRLSSRAQRGVLLREKIQFAKRSQLSACLYRDAMNLHINGEESTVITEPAGQPFMLAALIESLAMKSDRIAVELNREIVPRDLWSRTRLKDGDRLEIVHFVGGGCFQRARLSAAP
jgi:sulfur carrier protein